MLSKLIVKNYALISDLEVDLEKGFNVITGETGSGKSLLLGALGLLLGQNADFSKVRSSDKKCICEGYFNISDYQFESFFDKNDIDFEPVTIIRRELSKSGKSRAFINDTPVKLSILKELSTQLIDIHSQHENSKIHSKPFLYEVLDAFSNVGALLSKFRTGFITLKEQLRALEELKAKEFQLKSDRDYFEFQVTELSQVNLENIELAEIEAELNLLENTEEIRHQVFESSEFLNNDTNGALNALKNAQDSLQKIKQADESP